MFMSIDSFGIKVVLAIDIIPKKGGQCSFYLNLPKIKDLVTKKGVRLDTTEKAKKGKIMLDE